MYKFRRAPQLKILESIKTDFQTVLRSLESEKLFAVNRKCDLHGWKKNIRTVSLKFEQEEKRVICARSTLLLYQNRLTFERKVYELCKLVLCIFKKNSNNIGHNLRSCKISHFVYKPDWF